MRAVWIANTNGSRDVAIPFRIEFLMTRGDLATVLAFSVKDEDKDDELPILNRAQAVSIVRDVIQVEGTGSLWVWGDYLNEKRITEIQEWADETVERCFGAIFAAIDN